MSDIDRQVPSESSTVTREVTVIDSSSRSRANPLFLLAIAGLLLIALFILISSMGREDDRDLSAAELSEAPAYSDVVIVPMEMPVDVKVSPAPGIEPRTPPALATPAIDVIPDNPAVAASPTASASPAPAPVPVETPESSSGPAVR